MQEINFALRRATQADIQALLDFWRQNGDNGAKRTETPELVAQLICRDPDSVILAVIEEEIIGTVIAGWDGWRAALYRVAVRGDLKQSGIGTALIEAAKERLRQLGAPKIGAIVLEGNQGAQQFYTKLGFVREDNCRRWVIEL
jgi:ribosomal protein S18 acetylase RimI-like enzyme